MGQHNEIVSLCLPGATLDMHLVCAKRLALNGINK